MGIHYKFMSAKDYNSIPLGNAFISVLLLKRKIVELNYKSKNKSDSNGLCLGTDFDLLLINAKTNEEYTDDSMLIPNNSTVLIRRLPGTRHRKPIDASPILFVEKQQPKRACDKKTASASSGTSSAGSASIITDNTGSASTSSIGSGINDSGSSSNIGLYRSMNVSVTAAATNSSSGFVSRMTKSTQDSRLFDNGLCPIPGMGSSTNLGELDDEDRKIKILVNTPALPGLGLGSESVGVGRVVRRMGGYGFCGRLEKKTPPEGYVCRRCRFPGHFIQHCPTNGDPDYDFKRMRPPSGISKSMLMANPDGRSELLSVAAACTGVLQTNEKEMECSSLKRARLFTDIPEELLCPLCKQVMKYAVLTSKCCFKSFCDKCIRDHLLLSKLNCVCGATEMLTDYLIPNITVRNTINRFLESGSGSSSSRESAKSNSVQIENKQSAYCCSTILSAESSEKEQRQSDSTQQSAKTADEEVQQKTVSNVIAKKKRKRKASENAEVVSHMMPDGPYAYNPYWDAMQARMGGYMVPYGVGDMTYGGW
ncbi:E3 ubiquitin ligase PARAQUAT TOLERANCE 3-like [Jatropha curcas]|uniref:E3 ubiquitin ligase PARAQUAT TOLERANCE 3-like n=1 Tax=Jatropha curcas TaxID=180498 RepID=UPI001894BDA9|nr:E3 ubiquitin ligase PARAQUAT TOLERANCE 3-like [Jatropha curcas]